jgi:cytochrome c-type biogenesis protein CcmH
MFKIRAVLLLMVLLFTISASGAAAQVSREAMLDIAKELHPPGCTDSMTGDYCMLSTAYDFRAEIYGMLTQGKNKEQIINELVQKYGERILASPQAEGFHLVAWILPGAAILAGGLTIALFISAWVRGAAAKRGAAAVQPAITVEQKSKVEQELKQWL